ncbi:hypothetical protein FQA39_LY10460 [Lamprigera yunnana]|nr:hypothetical protein FQA39_LY10460 [Lamprigera yunnana]
MYHQTFVNNASGIGQKSGKYVYLRRGGAEHQLGTTVPSSTAEKVEEVDIKRNIMRVRNQESLSLAMVLSGVSRNEWEHMGYLYDKGEKMTNHIIRSSSSFCSTPRMSPSSDSGIASLSTDDRCSPRLCHDDLSLINVESTGSNKILKFLESLDNALEIGRPTPFPVCKDKLTWNQRNLLDLNSNLKKNEIFFTASILPPGVANFFDNRSQFSRLQGATIPLHHTNKCKNCHFIEYIFN